MLTTLTETRAPVSSAATLKLRPETTDDTSTTTSEHIEEPYRYAHLMPVFSSERYPPLVPFEHVDPGFRALNHPNPRSFLDNATVAEITPNLGSEITGVNLIDLDSDSRDQLALEVARRGLLVFRDQQAFVDSDPDFFINWGRHFGRLHIHPTSAHPEGLPEIHLVYRDENTTYNYELDDWVVPTFWHSDISYERQPSGLTTFFLLAQPETGGDTLFTSQVSALKKLSPAFVAFLRTLKAVHSGVAQANFSRSGKRGATVRREPVENVHPVIRRHPVTGDEAIFVNRQHTTHIVGLKHEESDAILNFLFNHIDRSMDNQARLKWRPNTVAVWDNRVTAHTAILDFKDPKVKRHGARITPQAERPIPALDGLKLDD
ncbi:alpha-ketoglutarate-dependent sulfonate dioxygenase [Fistulina hepatica ATCC 64428]|uniref:Alpha-ketoglutarate-dependent sulfonate dioxygenase n=1 Tax=Fistulina hepatica ATCC 64428 TaxID=1128425 RepID=A0A0D7AGU7_9AGAR|nr:alpha-ketoglutarate-dependent sulfonate dioxygenase [Fistulina hepatica ATCC 64428]